jgi:hypothetical protein
MEKPRRRWWTSPDLYPLWSCLGFGLFVATTLLVEWAGRVLDRHWIPKDLWWDLIHLPILPVELLFGGFQWELWSHWNFRTALLLEPELLFDAACYALSTSIYRELWRQIRGKRSSGSWLLLGFVAVLFIIQLLVATGWGITGTRW